MENYPYTFKEIPLSEYEDDPDIKVCIFKIVFEVKFNFSRMFTKSLQSRS